MEITIRKALPDDAHSLTDCHISCWQTAYKGIIPDEFLSNMSLEKDQRIERYKKILSDPGDCTYFLVLSEETIIGFLIINKNRNKDNSNIGEIWAIYLVEEFCGKGYGKELLEYVITQLKFYGCKNIFLWVFEDNKTARKFCEKNNFNFTGVKRESNYGKSLVQMEYELNFH